MKKQLIRHLWHLADRLDIAAEVVRSATMPHHLVAAHHTILDILMDLCHCRDYWADKLKEPTRRKGRRLSFTPTGKSV